MKKYAIAAILAFLGASSALAASPVTEATVARSPESVMATVETLSSTDTIRGISISSSPATSVIVDANAGYRFVAVQNLDAAARLYCGERSDVSSTEASDLVGIRISAGQLVSFSVRAFTNFYCKNDTGTGTTRAVIFRGR